MIPLFVLFTSALAGQPCLKIKNACTAAGYTNTKSSGDKHLYKHCVLPIMKGRSVASVVVDSEDVKQCQAKKAERIPKVNK